jgi:hypothetical protein
MFLEGTIVAPPTITPCSVDGVAVLPDSVPAPLVVEFMLFVVSAPLVVVVPESEQESKADEITKADAIAKNGLRINVFGFND